MQGSRPSGARIALECLMITSRIPLGNEGWVRPIRPGSPSLSSASSASGDDGSFGVRDQAHSLDGIVVRTAGILPSSPPCPSRPFLAVRLKW